VNCCVLVFIIIPFVKDRVHFFVVLHVTWVCSSPQNCIIHRGWSKSGLTSPQALYVSSHTLWAVCVLLLIAQLFLYVACCVLW
jgi:hypothetical protein